MTLPMNNTPQETILVVDDSPEMIAVLSGILRPLYRVQFATNGPAALALALAQRQPPA